MTFTGKTVLITGAGAGIGRAAAELFSQRGARVAVADIDAANAEETASSIRQAGGDATAFQVDVSQHDKVGAAIQAVQQQYGPIQVLVNNAGIALPSKSIVETDALHGSAFCG
jgi:NAD(P)-dependent dehydrogenase (short-subunit alcohol dehydrogenase family)